MKEVLAEFIVVLEDKGVEVLLIGGMAVNFYGYTRNTLDVDFMFVGQHQGVVREVMKGLGYTNISQHGGVTFFNRPGSSLRIDFLATDERTMKELLCRSIEAEIVDSRVKIPALLDLIAMKLFSLGQNLEQRMGKDLPDIVHLMLNNNLELERDIEPLALRYATREIYTMIGRHFEELK